MFVPGEEARCRKVLDALLEYEVGSPAQTYDRDQVTGTPASKVAAPPPPGVHLGIDGDRCPPISVSPYAHFSWMFANAETVEAALVTLHSAERMLARLLDPIMMSDLTEDSKTLALQGARSGEEISETILVQHEGWDADAVDIYLGIKPGTCRKVRASNFLDELGQPSGRVPKWLYAEFELIDSIGGKNAVRDRFQIAESTYYDVKSKIKKLREADSAAAA